jgi:hypothetical protein
VRKHKKGLLPPGMDRFLLGVLLFAAGGLTLLSTVLHREELKSFHAFRVITETKEHIVYKDPPVPPEPGYDTGNVTIKYDWQEVDEHDRRNGRQTGQYQVETPDGVVSLIGFCPVEGTFPSFSKGEQVNIHLVPNGSCSTFVRARRWK